ncbi:ABC-type phosphate transport system substrate-binding protein [Duganella sp. 1411]|uniref:phosphate ABC transporter substrate-binding protein n=1 Tax=Duganella sp. 1411 TaxID=2806572 RepID=UPI001B4BD851|nr:phosphate ABC transporter substrate-binding protein [Duganella sp. 1411]MBP1204733.1 ABC-type phosphate transport system substrate-binding protein [Duganella sp. 1411]
MTDRLLPLPVGRCLTASLLIVCAWLAAPGAASADDGARDPVIVVSAKNPLSSLRHEQVAAIFLAQTDRFPDGAEAVPLDLPPASAPRDAFYQRVAAMSPAQMKAYWTKMVFTGRAQPPRELRTSAAVRRMVADNPAMIGYIERAALDASVKVLEVAP